mgnify:FL=1
MDTYGIIGYPLGHSCSPRYFNERFQNENIDAEYLRFEIKDIQNLEHILKNNPTLKGFNVTIPHKQTILPFLDEISDEAKAIGAVNCVKVSRVNNKTKLYGYNTDMFGFRNALQSFMPVNTQH